MTSALRLKGGTVDDLKKAKPTPAGLKSPWYAAPETDVCPRCKRRLPLKMFFTERNQGKLQGLIRTRRCRRCVRQESVPRTRVRKRGDN